MDENEPDYRTYYQVVGYEEITAVVYGYGNTPQESLQDCINHFEHLLKNCNSSLKIHWNNHIYIYEDLLGY